MKKIGICFFLLFLPISSICSAQYQTIDELMRYLAFTDDRGLRKTALEYVVTHPEVAKEILFFPNPVSFQNAAKQNAFVCLKIASYRGFSSPEEFFDVSCRLIANIELYHPQEARERALKWYSTGLANYHWTEKPGTYKELSVMFENSLKALSAMEKNGLIVHSGIRNSLAAKIDGAKDAVDKHQGKGFNQAINKIEAAMSEANAQRNKGLKEIACVVFLQYCKNLIWQMNHTTF